MRDIHTYLLGSRQFGLDTPSSDFDYMRIFVDPTCIFDAGYKKIVKNENENGEITEVELSAFMAGVRDGDLKFIEALMGPSTPECLYPLRDYARSLDHRQMFLREINRRYNKSWYKEINPNAKNYNAAQQYDSKFAAHLYRVLVGSQYYVQNRSIKVDYSDIRKVYLSIKDGTTAKDEVFHATTILKEQIEVLFTGDWEEKEIPFPSSLYWEQNY
jgi:hypothetical protein